MEEEKIKLIKQIAYNIYQARMRGEIDGNAETDWVEAEYIYNKIFGDEDE